jgi:hypothetical protein
MADNEGGKAGARDALEAVANSAKRGKGGKRITRRQALAAGVGATAAVGAGLVTGRRVFLSTSKDKPAAAGKSTPPLATTTTTATRPPAATSTTGAEPDLPRWSDPASWGGKVPGPGDVATIGHKVMLDVDATVKGVVVEGAGELIFDPATTRKLTSTGNVVVMGALRMRPASPTVHHLLTLAGIDEGNYQGGDTHHVMDSDVGVWAMEKGVLDLMGTAKTAWTHLSSPPRAGATTIEVDEAKGWQAGDEIVVTPTESPAGDSEHWSHHDRRTITKVAGTTVSLDKPLSHPHPFTTVKAGVTHRGEVLNLTRNVRIEGTEGGRSHVTILHNMAVQKIGWVGLRWLGPHKVVGRYPLHFHMCGDGSRGSTVDGAVAYDGANHCFVPHLSNGVQYRDCITHDTADHAFWWDPAGDGQQAGDVPSHDILWERCVASFVQAGNDAHATTAFMMGAGRGNVARHCVAVGGSGASEGATGFRWGSGSNDETNTWVFEDNLTHNRSHSGLFWWQNNAPRTVVTRFTVYHCGQGIYAGSYINLVSYKDCTVYGCSDWGLTIAADPMQGLTSPDETITYEGMYIDMGGRNDYCVYVEAHTLGGKHTTKVSNCTFKGARKAQVGFPDGGEIPQMYDFTDCTFDGNAFYVGEGVPATSRIRVFGGNLGHNFQLHPAGGPGQHRPEWNATTTSL